jgi:hypothetical protein
MIIDYRNTFQRCPEVLQDVCNHRVEMANFILSLCPTLDEDRLFYEEAIQQYKCYDV